MKNSNKIGKYPLARIKVVGVGGAGGNAIGRMNAFFPKAVDLIAVNTDIQDLNYCQVKKKIHIGENITKGLGAGMDPELGRQAVEENLSEISNALKGADMVFIAAGMGGGTGTGASPVIAEMAKDLGILTVGIVTKPFSFEGSQRNQIAQAGLIKLKDRVDTLIVVPNDRIFSLISQETPLLKAFEKIDEVLKNAVQGIAELIIHPGIVNMDFADVKAVMEGAGSAIIGIGIAGGTERAVKAANQAVHSPLLETSVDGARGVLFSVSSRRDLKMNEINEIAELISENVDPAAKIIFGAYNDRKIKKGQLKVTLIATGFDNIINQSDSAVSLFNLMSSDLASENAIQGERKENEKQKEETRSFVSPNAAPEGKKIKTKTKTESKVREKIEDIWDIPTFLRKKKKR